MSLIDSILGLPGLIIERVERAHTIRVWARPGKRPACIHCRKRRYELSRRMGVL